MFTSETQTLIVHPLITGKGKVCCVGRSVGPTVCGSFCPSFHTYYPTSLFLTIYLEKSPFSLRQVCHCLPLLLNSSFSVKKEKCGGQELERGESIYSSKFSPFHSVACPISLSPLVFYLICLQISSGTPR